MQNDTWDGVMVIKSNKDDLKMLLDSTIYY